MGDLYLKDLYHKPEGNEHDGNQTSSDHILLGQKQKKPKLISRFLQTSLEILNKEGNQ